MKTCQVCLQPSPDAEPTCPYCGEASWSEVSVEKPAEKAAEPKPQPQPSNGRQNDQRGRR